MAIVKLIKKFPINIFSIEFPRIIQTICNNLKSRDNEERNNARKALFEITKIMGPYFLDIIIK